jgi:hypothetical protein
VRAKVHSKFPNIGRGVGKESKPSTRKRGTKSA